MVRVRLRLRVRVRVRVRARARARVRAKARARVRVRPEARSIRRCSSEVRLLFSRSFLAKTLALRCAWCG